MKHQQIRSALRGRALTWIAGNQYDSSLALDLIFKEYGRENVVVLDGVADGIERIVSHLVETEIFAAGTKIIRVKGLPADYHLIADYLDYVDSSRVLVIESPFQTKVGHKRINVKSSKLYKEIKRTGKVFDFPIVVSPAKARTWTTRVLKRVYQKEIGSDALELLVEYKNNNLDLIYSELGKLAAYTGKRKKINKEDIEDCVYLDLEFNVWAFIDDLTSASLPAAIEKLEKYFLTEENFIYKTEMLIGAILFRFELLLFARSRGKTVDLDDLRRLVGGFQKSAREEKISPKYSDGALRAFVYSNVVQKAIQNKGTAYWGRLLSAIYFTYTGLRLNRSKPATSRLLLLNLVETICGRINTDDFIGIYREKEEEPWIN